MEDRVDIVIEYDKYKSLNDNKKTAYIFDMDGTLADVSGILHYIKKSFDDSPEEKFTKKFQLFHSEGVNVPPHQEAVDLLNFAKDAGHHILVVTARREMWRPHTSMWLALNNIYSDALFMRNNHDNRKDYEIKQDILNHILQLWDVVHAVDDNPKVIKLWEENGIPTTKIGTWDGND